MEALVEVANGSGVLGGDAVPKAAMSSDFFDVAGRLSGSTGVFPDLEAGSAFGLDCANPRKNASIDAESGLFQLSGFFASSTTSSSSSTLKPAFLRISSKWMSWEPNSTAFGGFRGGTCAGVLAVGSGNTGVEDAEGGEDDSSGDDADGEDDAASEGDAAGEGDADAEGDVGAEDDADAVLATSGTGAAFTFSTCCAETAPDLLADSVLPWGLASPKKNASIEADSVCVHFRAGSAVKAAKGTTSGVRVSFASGSNSLGSSIGDDVRASLSDVVVALPLFSDCPDRLSSRSRLTTLSSKLCSRASILGKFCISLFFETVFVFGSLRSRSSNPLSISVR